MANERLGNIVVTSQIPPELSPFRPDPRTELRPSLISNGGRGKIPFFLAIGITAFKTSDEVNFATESAEDEYHRLHGDNIFGEYMMESGIPYPAMLAAEKMKAAVEILKKDGIVESFITHDACYMLKFDGHEGEEITLHKQKTLKDIERCAKLLYWASNTQNTCLYSVSGVVRYDEFTGDVELYGTETNLGLIQPFDMTALLSQFSQNPHIAMGAYTYQVPSLLVKKKSEIPLTLTKYVDAHTGGNVDIFKPGWQAKPGQSATGQFGTETPENIQLAGIGLIQY